MDAEVTLFTKPEELIAWADTFDILLNPSIEDAAILLNYMEGHDYAIGIDSDGKIGMIQRILKITVSFRISMTV